MKFQILLLLIDQKEAKKLQKSAKSNIKIPFIYLVFFLIFSSIHEALEVFLFCYFYVFSFFFAQFYCKKGQEIVDFWHNS
jgi:hypothetical protein